MRTRSGPSSSALDGLRRLVLVAAAASMGCTSAPRNPAEGTGGAEGTEAVAPDDGLNAEQRAHVEAACSQCHPLPPPESLSKGVMIEQVHAMFGIPVDSGLPPASLESIALAQRYYEARSPASLPFEPQAERIAEKLRFVAEGFTPTFYAGNPIPATSHVQFASLWDPTRQDLLFAEMRSRSLLWLSPWRLGAERQVYAVHMELNYPVQAHVVDMDGDGTEDLLVASIGDMNRDNSRKGTVSVLLREPDGPWTEHVVARRLARPVAVRPLDADGDGDLDLVVAAFGWAGPGQLLLLENRTTDWSDPVFAPHVLDERDGFIKLETADLDGDGRMDFVAAIAQEQEQVIAFLSRGDLGFEQHVIYRGLHPAWGTSGLQLLDFDADGDIDVLVTNGDTLDDNELKPYHGARWLENLGGLEFAEHWIGTCYGCQQVVAGDLDGDGDLDVVGASWLSQLPPELWREKDLDSVVWFERLPLGWRRHAIEKHANHHPTVALGDWNADGRLDILVGNWTWIGGDGAAVFGAPAITLFTQR